MKGLFARSCLYWLTIPMQLLFCSTLSANAEEQSTVRFCAPQNDVYPFFVTQNGELTGINPEIIRQIFESEALQGVELVIERRPWKRCNSDLERGAVDAMIGGYDEQRVNVVYPTKLGFELNKSAVSTADVCFSTITGHQLDKVKRGISTQKPFVVGIEPGFTRQHSIDINPKWVELYNPVEKYRMLKLGRVDAIVQVCAMDSDYAIKTKAENAGFNDFVTLYPPYLSNPAYVVFSEKFVEQNEAMAKRIVSLSQNIDKAKIYKQYQVTY